MTLVLSVGIYLICFISSWFMFRQFEIIQKRYMKFKLISYRGFICVLAILIPCLIAGLRADTVGVDVKVYAVNALSQARQFSSLPQMLTHTEVGGEWFYVILVYVLSHFTKETGVLLFLLQFLTLVPILKAAYILRDKLSISFTMLVYFLLFYNDSLNIMRQSIACSFILLGCTFWFSEEYMNRLKSILCMITACFFHRSAFIGIILIIGVILLSRSHMRKLIRIPAYVLLVLSPAFISALILKLQQNGFLSERYNFYADVFINKSISRNYFSSPFSRYNLIFVGVKILLVLIAIYAFQYQKKKNNMLYKFERILLQFIFIGFMIFTVVLYSLKTTYGIRISVYLDYFIIILLPLCCKSRISALSNGTFKVTKLKLLVLATIFAYWIIWIMYMGWSGSSAYAFRI